MSDITYINKNLLMEGQLESKEGQVVIAGKLLFKIISFHLPLSEDIFSLIPVTASIAVLPIKIIILGSIIDICSFKKFE